MKHRISIVSKKLDNGRFDVAILFDGNVERVFRNISVEILQSIYEYTSDSLN